MPETELKVTTHFTALDTLIHISWQPKMPGASDTQKYRSRKLGLPNTHFWGVLFSILSFTYFKNLIY